MGSSIVNIAFWVSNEKNNGLGHIRRCQLIAKELEKSNIKSYFFSSSNYFNLTSENNFFQISENINEIVSFFNKNNIQFLFVDNYFIDQKLINEVSQKIKTCQFVIHSVNTQADAVFNSNFYAKDFNRDMFESKNFFFGPEFRPKLNFDENILSQKKNNDCFICLGATFNEAILSKLISSLDPKKTYSLVIPNNIDHHFLTEIAINKNLNLKVYQSPNNFYEIFNQSKECIISASNLTFEAIALNIPMITVSFVNNHKQLAEYLFKEYEVPCITEDLLTTDFIRKAKPTKIESSIIGKRFLEFTNYILEGTR